MFILAPKHLTMAFLGFIPFTPDSSFLTSQTLGCSGDALCNYVSAIHVRDLDCIPTFLLQPRHIPSCNKDLENESEDESVLNLSPYITHKNKNLEAYLNKLLPFPYMLFIQWIKNRLKQRLECKYSWMFYF